MEERKNKYLSVFIFFLTLGVQCIYSDMMPGKQITDIPTQKETSLLDK